MRRHSRFSALYDEVSLPENYRRSLRLMLCSCACGNMFGVIKGGAAFTGYTEFLGTNDFLYGLMMATPYLAALTQLPMALFMSHTGKRKKWLLLFGGISRLLWIPIAIVPLLFPGVGSMTHIWIVLLLNAISSMCSSAVNVGFTPWMGEFVSLPIRGRWLACRHQIESVISVGFGLLIARLLNMLPSPVSYYTVLLIGAILGCMDICFYIGVTEIPIRDHPTSLFSSLREILRNRPFLQFCLFWGCLEFSKALASAYYIRYAGTDLGLNDGQCVLCFQIAGCVIGLLCISRWGKSVDAYGNYHVLAMTQSLLAATPLLWLLAALHSIWIPLIYNILAAILNCCQTMMSTSLLLEKAPHEKNVIYIAVYSCGIQLLGAFPGALCGGALLSFFRAMPFSYPDAYQLLFLTSALLQGAVLALFLPGMKPAVQQKTITG